MFLKVLADNFLDLIFPKNCLNCNSGLDQNEDIICRNCESSLVFLSESICKVCGKPLENNICKTCSNTEHFFDKARSVFLFEKTLRNVIHNLKYEEMTKIGKYLGKFASVYLKENNPFENIDFIAPVPLHKVKKRIRGFNQSEYISRKIAADMNWNHIPDLVLRKRFTDSQTRLSRAGRQKNVSNAFLLNKKYDMKNKNILLIDDVFTTGSTVNSISKHLKDNGVNKVFVLTVARA
ncbi:MAG TPA: ComF family protein [Candidatus Cloacimonetes bacterium]|nr:ComF family protein [Candidatus Cloacimonadota bacterium]